MKTRALKQVFMVGLMVSQSFLITSLEAEIFKCTNLTGKVYYNDKPCPEKDSEQKIRHEKDVKNGYTPPVFEKESEPESRRGVVIGRNRTPSNEKSREKDESEDEFKNEEQNESASGNRKNTNQNANSGGTSNVITMNNASSSVDDEAEDRIRASQKQSIKPRKLTLEEKRKILNVKEVHE